MNEVTLAELTLLFLCSALPSFQWGAQSRRYSINGIEGGEAEVITALAQMAKPLFCTADSIQDLIRIECRSATSREVEASSAMGFRLMQSLGDGRVSVHGMAGETETTTALIAAWLGSYAFGRGSFEVRLRQRNEREGIVADLIVGRTIGALSRVDPP